MNNWHTKKSLVNRLPTQAFAIVCKNPFSVEVNV